MEIKNKALDAKSPGAEPGKAIGPGKADSDHVARLNRIMGRKGQTPEEGDELEDELNRGFVLTDDAIGDAGQGARGMAGMSALFAGLVGKGGTQPDSLQAPGSNPGLVGKGGTQSDFSETPDTSPGIAAGLPIQGEMGRMPAVAEIAPAEWAGPANLDNLVERILVSVPKADGTAEVRIKLDPRLLLATEITLKSQPGEGLTVEFMSDNVDSQRFLLPNLSSLQERLTDRTGDMVTVRMSENASGDTGDGRSRNRRNLYEEMGDKRL